MQYQQTAHMVCTTIITFRPQHEHPCIVAMVWTLVTKGLVPFEYWNFITILLWPDILCFGNRTIHCLLDNNIPTNVSCKYYVSLKIWVLITETVYRYGNLTMILSSSIWHRFLTVFQFYRHYIISMFRYVYVYYGASSYSWQDILIDWSRWDSVVHTIA